jgi:hypothetical protein
VKNGDTYYFLEIEITRLGGINEKPNPWGGWVMIADHFFRPFSRLLKNGHLLRFPHPSSLRRTAKYASLLRISGALHLTFFEQPVKGDFFEVAA